MSTTLNQNKNASKRSSNQRSLNVINAGRQLTHKGAIYALDANSISSNAGTIYTKSTGYNNTYVVDGNYNLETGNGTVTINSGNTGSSALSLLASNTTGGLLIQSGTGGMVLDTSGALSISSNSGDVTVGSASSDNVDIIADQTITLTADDITGIATDDIIWRSTTGEVILDTGGNSVDSALRVTNSGQLVMNGNSLSADEFQVELLASTGSNVDSGRNGMLIRSTDSSIAPEYRVKYTNSSGSSTVINTMGVYSENSTVAKYRSYYGYQYGNQLVVIDGPDWEDNDVGKRVVFSQDGRLSNIAALGTIITPASNSYSNSSITVGGVYTGITTQIFKVEVDSVANVDADRPSDTFRWSNNGGQTYNDEFLPMTYGLAQRYPLQDGVYVSFESNTGHSLYDHWTFDARRTAIVDNNIIITGSTTNDGSEGNVVTSVVNNVVSISTGNTTGAPVFSNITGEIALSRAQTFSTTAPFQGYFGTTTNSDLIFKTADTERFRVNADGSIGTGGDSDMDARLRLSSNYNGPILVNHGVMSSNVTAGGGGIDTGANIATNTLGYQLNPVSSELATGGYVVIYESQDQTEDSDTVGYDIYGDYFTAGGDKSGSGLSFRVNITQSKDQSHPYVCRSGSLGSDNYLVVWVSQDPEDATVYQIRGQLFQNGTEKVFTNNDMILASTTTNVKLSPRCCGLTNGNYVIVYSSLQDDDSDGGTTENYLVKYLIINSSGNVVTASTTLTSDTGIDYIYPSVGRLSAKDPNYPGGWVVAYMKQVYTNDPRYQLVYKVANAVGSSITDERNITTTGVSGAGDLFGNSDVSLSDGLPEVIGLSDSQARLVGGFLVGYQTNYSASVNYSTIAGSAVRNITGVSSTAEANLIDASIDGTTGVQTLVVDSTNGTFLEGEQIYLVADEGFLVEKIETATIDGSNVNIVLSQDPKDIRLAKYSTVNLGTSSYNNLLWRQTVNTTGLVLDEERAELNASSSSPGDFTRDETIFYAYRGRVGLSDDSGDRAIMAWQSGSQPSVYYQLLDLSDGGLTGSEELVAETRIGLRQTDPATAQLRNRNGVQLGWTVTFSTNNQDHSRTAIYQELVPSPDSYLLHLNNKTAEFVCDNQAQLGVGTKTPAGSLHLKTLDSQNKQIADICTLVMQNSRSDINNADDNQRIRFLDGSGTELARIKVKYSEAYQDMHPKAESLASYYKFDESPGSLIALDSGLYNVQSGSSNVNVNNNNQNALLVNFDVNTCWQTGLINNGLLFDGDNDHVKVPLETVSAASLDRLTNSASGWSMSGWFKIGQNIFSGTRMDLLSFGTADVGQAAGGAVQLYLDDTLDTGVLFPHMRYTLDGSGSANVLEARPSDTSIGVNTGSFRHLVITYNATDEEFKTYLDNTELTTWFKDTVSVSNGEIGGALETIEADLDTYFGCNVSANGNFFRGMMDELRFYQTVLSTTDIAKLYRYGSERRGQLVIQTRGDNGDFSDTGPGLVLNDRGRLAGLGVDGNVFRQLTGTVVVSSSTTTTLGGEGTQFTKELKAGDVLYIDNKASDLELSNDDEVLQRLYTVTAVASDTSCTIHRPIPDVTGLRYFTYVTVRPGIFTATDLDEIQQLSLDYNGDLVLGSGKSANNLTRLEIRGTGAASSKSGLTLSNTAVTETATEGGRSNKFIFRASNATAVDAIQGLIEVSHNGTNEDNKAKMRISLNNNQSITDLTNDMTHALTLFPSGKVSIGQEIAETQALGDLHLRGQNDTPATIALYSEESATGALTERSRVTWYGSDSYTNNSAGLVRVQGANDKYILEQESVANGRLDISLANYSSSDERDLGLIPRLSLTAQGNVGVHTQRPTAVFSVSPKFIKSDATTIVEASVSVNGPSSIEFDTEILSNNINTALLRAGSVVVKQNGNVSAYAISATSPRIDNSNLALDSATALTGLDLSGLSGGSVAGISVHYPGLYVNNKGLIGMGDSRFNDAADTNYRLAVSGNTVVKGIVQLFEDITSTASNVCLQCNSSDQLEFSDAATNGSYVRVFGGPHARAITTKTSGYNIAWSDSTILANGAITVTLPEPAAMRAGQIFTIKNISASTVTVGRAGSGIEIDGSASDLSLATQYDSVTVQTDGSNWWKIGEYNA